MNASKWIKFVVKIEISFKRRLRNFIKLPQLSFEKLFISLYLKQTYWLVDLTLINIKFKS